MTWHQNQQQLGNIWECRSRSPKHESHWGSLSQIRLEKWMKQPSRFSWLMIYPYYTHYSLGQIPIFPAWTQLRWLLEGKLLKHFALLQGFSWPMSQVWSGIRIMEISSGFNGFNGGIIKKALWLCLKSSIPHFMAILSGKMAYQTAGWNGVCRWLTVIHGMIVLLGSNFHAPLWTILAIFQGCHFQD